MVRADYKYAIKDRVIYIIDLDLGSKSVTNDIENVVEEIEMLEDIDANDYTIHYQDSSGNWDGWDKKTESFILLSIEYTEPNGLVYKSK